MDARTSHRLEAWLPVFGGLLVVILAFVLSGDPDHVSVFGWDVPVVCVVRRVAGIPCPGCGLTRSFVLIAHGQLIEAWRANVLGPPLFVALVAWIPWRASSLLSRARAAGSPPAPPPSS